VRRLVLVRHGESIWNAERRIQGQACAGLSARGHAQAAAAALALAATYPGARLVTSDLQRTRETVAPLEAVVGRRAEQDPRLRERSFGTWERRLRDEVAQEEGDRWQRWLGGEDVVGEVGGESAEDLVARVRPVLWELLEATPDGGVTIAVTHGGPVWHGVHDLVGVPPGTFGGVDNASLHELLAFGGGGVGSVLVDRWNETGHVPAHLRSGWTPAVAVTNDGNGDGSGRGALAADAPPVGR
jgi:broad specificity phosphatase PhoE